MAGSAAAAAASGLVKPILKWAGGKRQLLPALRPYYPAAFERYVEPFLGSGAVFLDLWNLGRLAGRPVRLSDINADVIGCYSRVRDSLDAVVAELRRLEAGHRAGGAAHFYEVRDNRFNDARRRLPEGPAAAAAYDPRLAAMLIYLNRTGYNGLFRVNARGAFNVPAGRYARVTICDAANLGRVSEALRGAGVRLEVASFETALAACGRGDFVYLDPPYAPLTGTARFTSYTAGGFGPERQRALQRAVVHLAGSGGHVLLSNSSAPEIRRLYASNAEARRAGLRARTVRARRAINSRATGRAGVAEYLITNVRPVRRAAGVRVN